MKPLAIVIFFNRIASCYIQHADHEMTHQVERAKPPGVRRAAKGTYGQKIALIRGIDRVP
eukprot:scaffold4407_cov138-Skeletonema_menzelii.AAC.3